MMKQVASWIVCVVFSVNLFADTELPLKSVTLFTSGVGYFEHEGVVNGDDGVPMSFDGDLVNDVLKSLVVLDQSGNPASVTLDARDPLEKTLSAYRLNLADNPSTDRILNRLRGVRIKVLTGADEMEGRVVGVESHMKMEDDQATTSFTLKLGTGTSLLQVPLDQVRSFEILNEQVARDFQAALETLGENLAQNQKSLRINLQGEGEREVSAGYLLETPVWKTSFRLVLDEKDAWLQGWGHIENTTAEDWKDVQVSLVSGQPISFIQDLYQPLYFDRPVVAPRLYEGLAPREYEAGFGGMVEEDKSAPEFLTVLASEMSTPALAARGAAYDNLRMRKAGLPMKLGRDQEAGRGASASGKTSGELFEYQIDQRVSLPRQQASMLPIVSGRIPIEPFSIFGTRDDTHPMNGLRLENATRSFLMEGPATIYEEGIYAGDAILPDTQAGEKRLISYSVDLAIDVKKELDSRPSELVSMRAVKGVLYFTRKYQQTMEYTFKSKRSTDRRLLVEHRKRQGWELMKPAEPMETTEDLYRFEMELPAKAERTLVVTEEQVSDQGISLSNQDVDTISIYIREKVISAPLRAALEKLAAMKMELAETGRRIAGYETRLNDISQDQNRLRENMKAVSHGSANYARWEKKLAEQEVEIDELTEKLRDDREAQRLQQMALDDYLANLKVG